MLYHAFELTHAALAPMKALCRAENTLTESGLNPWAGTVQGRTLHAACQLFDGITHRYGRPDWGIEGIEPDTVWSTPFVDLVQFRKDQATAPAQNQSRVLVVAPLSGHYPTLLRGTVEALLPEHDVYITDWRDGREIPVNKGPFDLDDFIDTVIDMLRVLGPDTHVIAVCQPSVPVLAATALMATDDDPNQPRSLVLMGGPIDARVNPTPANLMIAGQDRAWFEQTAISRVPFPHAGAFRPVYPGFLQLSGFLFKNLDRHIDAQMTYFNQLVEGDGDSARRHRAFYEEFLAAMDLPAEFFLQTVETVFQTFDLARGKMKSRGRKIDPAVIRRTALMTIEGGRDDICPPGQTIAAQVLCPNIPAARKQHFEHPDVGHYGVFNGRRWREDIRPRISAFIAAAEKT